MRTGVNLIPETTVAEVVAVAVEAERLGFDRCWVYDEGLATRDTYVTLCAIAAATKRLELGPGITNPYTRHPAQTASAVASLDEMSAGRAFLGIGAGGSLTLDPIGVLRAAPLTAVREAIDVARELFTGRRVDYAGKTVTLRSASMVYGRPGIEIWLAGRGPKMLALGGAVADGVSPSSCCRCSIGPTRSNTFRRWLSCSTACDDRHGPGCVLRSAKMTVAGQRPDRAGSGDRVGSGKPGFDEPCFTVFAAERFVDGVLPGVPLPSPLPALVPDGPGPTVLEPVDEPMVRIEHRRIRCLANYWHAGWEHAVPATLLRAEAARLLGSVADSLPPRWGLAVFDAWRPLELQRELFDAAYADPVTEPGFMAPVSEDPTTPPPHNTGGAVDLSLTYDWLPLAAGCGFDDITSRAHIAWTEDRPGADRELRRLLYWSMRAAGFVVYAHEWWHFEFGTSRWAQITGQVPRYGPADVSPFGFGTRQQHPRNRK